MASGHPVDTAGALQGRKAARLPGGDGKEGAERGPEWSGVEEQVAKNLSQESGQEVGCM